MGTKTETKRKTSLCSIGVHFTNEYSEKSYAGKGQLNKTFTEGYDSFAYSKTLVLNQKKQRFITFIKLFYKLYL